MGIGRQQPRSESQAKGNISVPTSTTSRPSAKNSRKTSWYVTPLRVLAIVTTLGVAVVFWAAKITLSPINDRGQAVGNTDAGHSLRFYNRGAGAGRLGEQVRNRRDRRDQYVRRGGLSP
jgi:hypothetical protein